MRRTWRQIEGRLVEITPGPRLPEELRFDSPFISPVDGSVIQNKRDLNDHNARNGVTQVLPGMGQDIAAIREKNRNPGKQQRIEAVRKAMEN